MKCEIYPDKKGEWRWRLVARNGRIIADSGEGYVSKANAKRAMHRLRAGLIRTPYYLAISEGERIRRDGKKD